MRRMKFAGIVAAVGVILGGGAVAFVDASPTDGVRQARDWLYAGDIAKAQHQWREAYEFYLKAAEVFPDTPHGRVAAKRARALVGNMISVERSSASEDPPGWVEEFFDFLVWP